MLFLFHDNYLKKHMAKCKPKWPNAKMSEQKLPAGRALPHINYYQHFQVPSVEWVSKHAIIIIASSSMCATALHCERPKLTKINGGKYTPAFSNLTLLPFRWAASLRAVGNACSNAGLICKLRAACMLSVESPPAAKKFSVGSSLACCKVWRNVMRTLVSDWAILWIAPA